MRTTLRLSSALFLVLSLSACVSPMPNFEACSPLTDITDYTVERQAGFCRYTLTKDERTVYGEEWLTKVRSGVIVDLDSWVKFVTWAKQTCRKHNNECVDK